MSHANHIVGSDPTCPEISRDLVAVVATCRSAVSRSRALTGAPLSLRDAIDVVCTALSSRSVATSPTWQDATGTWEPTGEVVVAALSGALTGGDTEPGVLGAVLRRAWVTPREPGRLDDTIGALMARAVDAERITTAIIGYEAQRHVRLVWHEAYKLSRHFPGYRAEELVTWGWLGLRVALRNFDPARGFKFSTYACQRISGAIRDGVRSENPVPKRLTTFQRKAAKAEEALHTELGRVPSLEEVAMCIDADLETLRALLPRLNAPASIEEITANASERTTREPDWLVNDDDPADRAVSQARREACEAAVASLPEDERVAVRMLLWENRSCTDAARELGVSPRQLRQRCQRGQALLADVLAEWAPAAA